MLAPATLRTLGGTETIIHIGSLFTNKAGSTRAQVYVVEFTNGEHICTLNQRVDGTLDQFQCDECLRREGMSASGAKRTLSDCGRLAITGDYQ